MGDMAAMVITLERDLPMLTVIMVDILEDTDMAAMVTTLERDLPKLTAITEDILEDTDMAVMVTTSERDLPMLIAIMEDILEDMDMAVTVTTSERDLLMPKASHTTDTEVCMVDMAMVDSFMENRFQSENRGTDALILFNFMIWLLVISNFNQR